MTRSCRFWFVKQTFLPQNHLMWTARTSARFQANYEFTSPAQKICRTIALRAVTNYRPETDKQTETFVWLLSLKCHVCQSSVIKMKKMTKLRQKLQISHPDVIRALRYLFCFKKQNKISSNGRWDRPSRTSQLNCKELPKKEERNFILRSTRLRGCLGTQLTARELKMKLRDCKSVTCRCTN